MVATSEYGSWYNVTGDSDTPGAAILDITNGGDAAWRSRMEESGAFARIETEWRSAIQAALPPWVSMRGNDFIGPAFATDMDFAGYPLNEDGELDLKAIVEGIDLQAIIERHDVDNQP